MWDLEYCSVGLYECPGTKPVFGVDAHEKTFKAWFREQIVSSPDAPSQPQLAMPLLKFPATRRLRSAEIQQELQAIKSLRQVATEKHHSPLFCLNQLVLLLLPQRRGLGVAR